MMRRCAVILFIVSCALGAAACAESGTTPTATSTVTVTGTAGPTSNAVPASAAAAESSTVASESSTPSAVRWAGTWQSAGDTQNATLQILSADPLTAVIDVNRCGAEWTQQSRDTEADGAQTIVVAAKVEYGDCSDNTWKLTVTDDSISGVDVNDPSTTVRFTPTDLVPDAGP